MQQNKSQLTVHINTIVVCYCIEMQTLEYHTKGLLSFVVYLYDFDINGVCNWLGTNKEDDTWQNPELRGYIRVLYSSLVAYSKHAHCVIGRELIHFVTDPKKQSWFVIGLKNIESIRNHYSLKHYIIFNTKCLRNWKFEPSDDPKGNKRILKYTQDIDFNGLSYFLCTNERERQWANSIDLRFVNIDASSLRNDYAQLSGLCGCASVICVTKTHHKPLISINIKDIKIRLSYYKLGHYMLDKEQLRFLVFEGNDKRCAKPEWHTNCLLKRQNTFKDSIFSLLTEMASTIWYNIYMCICAYALYIYCVIFVIKLYDF
ncbi:hypothetical protein RFI_22320 [Reticulomyxa filosa]|uniref:Uncharacterized protein n=1 Tax=Reticulomyxa filosa TaxID=46433 RepID=X6MMG9_RETFI|nr:hypothetical protein RFI_22320 [Reticulomyxa filosa]|eukprot:ETO15044.1 hypothetical protein RFI_22320 [Reticulomyxa filosa]